MLRYGATSNDGLLMVETATTPELLQRGITNHYCIWGSRSADRGCVQYRRTDVNGRIIDDTTINLAIKEADK